MAVVISPNLVIPGANSDTPPFPLSHARIGYQSLLAASMVTATSEAAGFPASALVNGLTYDQWRPTALPATLDVDLGEAKDCDYMGIAAHNFATIGATVTAEYSTDGGSTWTTVSEFSPGDNNPIMLIFDTITARYWRLVVDAPSGTLQMGVLYLGEALAMQRSIYGGVSPITLARRTEYNSNISDSGQWLGRTIVRKGSTASFEWRHLTADWYRENFDPFVKAARTTAFFIAWYPSKYPGEVGYCMTTGDVRPSNMGVSNLMSVSIQCEGFSDD